jgi:hypothetical protein
MWIAARAAALSTATIAASSSHDSTNSAVIPSASHFSSKGPVIAAMSCTGWRMTFSSEIRAAASPFQKPSSQSLLGSWLSVTFIGTPAADDRVPPDSAPSQR